MRVSLVTGRVMAAPPRPRCHTVNAPRSVLVVFIPKEETQVGSGKYFLRKITDSTFRPFVSSFFIACFLQTESGTSLTVVNERDRQVSLLFSCPPEFDKRCPAFFQLTLAESSVSISRLLQRSWKGLEVVWGHTQRLQSLDSPLFSCCVRCLSSSSAGVWRDTNSARGAWPIGHCARLRQRAERARGSPAADCLDCLDCPGCPDCPASTDAALRDRNVCTQFIEPKPMVTRSDRAQRGGG